MKFLKETLLFLFGLSCAYYYNWQSSDLLWSFWTTSFIVGYATIIVNSLISPYKNYKKIKVRINSDSQHKEPVPKLVKDGLPIVVLIFSSLGSLFLLAFFTVHFGGFHSVHAMFLNQYAPIENIFVSPTLIKEIPLLEKFPNLIMLLKLYWPIVITGIISEFYMTEKSHQTTKVKTNEQHKQMMFKPYINVIKIHILIFIIMGLKEANIYGFKAYAIIFFIFYFPFSAIFSKRKNLPSKSV